MISTCALQRIAGKFYRSGIRTISKSSTDSSVEVNVAKNDVENGDMPVRMQNPFVKEKRQCILCKLNVDPDYKNVRLLSQFQSQYTGRVYASHITGLCKYKQKRVEDEIAKAQVAGLMAYWTKEPKYIKDPQLFDANYPFRPHKY